MDVALAMCAPSDNQMGWHGIDWAKCHKDVRRLQARIVKAVKSEQWGRVKALQWLLTHSFHGKALAVKRVTENRGKRTPGVDGETWSTPTAKAKGITRLKRRGYQPKPLRRVNIPKSNGKTRPLGIPTILDRAMQALHLQALDPINETLGDRSSFGFRKFRSCADAIEQCFLALAPKRAAQWVLEGDIKGCFDNISHQWMLENIRTDKVILHKWLKAGYVENKKLFPTEAGTPQGGIISPALANQVLDGIEDLIFKMGKVTFDKRGIKNNPHKLNVIRYADDFVVTSSSKEYLEMHVVPALKQFLEIRGLELSETKTKISEITQGFDFLGQNLRKYKGTLLVKPSKKSVSDIAERIRGIIENNKSATQGNLINLLNPVIRGWAMCHRHIVASETFSSLDKAVWNKLWQWAIRRHRNKNGVWIKQKYFRNEGDRNWVFGWEDERGTVRRLQRATDIKIVRHVKIQGRAKPYDPEFEEYFEERLRGKMLSSTAGRRKLLSLWLSQGGSCPVCCTPITKETGWHLHHIKRKADGGGDEQSNLALLHQNCHAQVHSLKLESLPGPRKQPLRKA